MSVEKFQNNIQPQPESDPQMAALVGRMRQVMEDSSVDGTPRKHLLAQAEQSIAKHFTDNEEAFADYLAWLEDAHDLPDDELARQAARRWHETVIGEFGPREVEARERADMGEQFVPLDEDNTIGYTVAGESLDLHVQSARTLSTVEKVRAIKTALAELSDRLKTEAELSDVAEITATSWIVANNPRLMEKLGFTIDGPVSADDQPDDLAHRGKDAWQAHISIEDFLKKHSPKKD